jgi:phosphatidate cytidylyltransferase
MSNLTTRILTAVVGVPVILAILYLGPPLATFILVGLALALAALEFLTFSHPQDRLGRYFGAAVTLGLYLTLVGTGLGRTHPMAIVLACLALPPVILLFSLARPGDIPSALLHGSTMALSALYLGGAMACLALLRVEGSGSQGPGLVLLALTIAWSGDTGGYFVGRRLKGPKLYPAVSPNKTWSGAIGGLLASVLGVLLIRAAFLHGLPLGRSVVLALVAGALGQAGDLCESILKRSAGVKDSGGLLPGHGGLLDRVDAVLFVAPTIYLVLRLGWIRLGS